MPEVRPVGRSLLLAMAVGVLVGVAAFAVAFGIVAVPFFALAQAEGAQGLDRPVIRVGLLRATVAVGAVAGIVAGVVVGRWYRRGGELPAGDAGG